MESSSLTNDRGKALYITGVSGNITFEHMSPDEHRILEFLNATPGFISVIKISLKVGGRKRCRTAPCWAEQHLLRLTNVGVLEMDAKGRFRSKPAEKVHLAPHIAEILARAKALQT